MDRSRLENSVETLVVGAGVIGLAIAREFARAGQEVLVIDSADAIGTETSARNSEVVHSGIYNPPGSLKSRLCVEGRELLYAFCQDCGIAAPQIGKIIVASRAEELPKLDALEKTAVRNGVGDLVRLSAAEVRSLEPELVSYGGLLSPSTGIVDGKNFMLALLGDAEAHGGILVLRTSFKAARRLGDRHVVTLSDDQGVDTDILCLRIINCAGHGAHAVAAAIEGVVKADLPPRYLAKGSYCAVSGRSPFKRLIYPMPVPGALGIHVTLDLGGQIRLGPNIEWVEQLDYSVEPGVAEEFKRACENYWPGVAQRQVTASYCGIRPKIHRSDELFADFRIDGPLRHGVPGVVSLFGIESPGLTSSMAIGLYVRELISS